MIAAWIDSIMRNPALLSNFREDLQKRIEQSEREGMKWIEEGNIHKAQVEMGKAKAYRSLLYSLLNTINEEVQKNEFIQKTTGKSVSTRRPAKD